MPPPSVEALTDIQVQERAVRRSRKQAREAIETNALISAAGTRPRASKVKALAAPVWAGEMGRRPVSAAIASSVGRPVVVPGESRPVAAPVASIAARPIAASGESRQQPKQKASAVGIVRKPKTSAASQNKRGTIKSGQPVSRPTTTNHAAKVPPPSQGKPVKPSSRRPARAQSEESELSQLTASESEVDYFTGEGESEHAGSSAEDDDNAGLSGLAEADLQELMRREGASFEGDTSSVAVQDPADLFDIDEADIECVPLQRPAAHLAHAADLPSSDEARPPTSESDATEMNTSFDNDEHAEPRHTLQDDRRKVVPPAVSKNVEPTVVRTGKRKNAKQESRYRDERPQIAASDPPADLKAERKAKRQRKLKESKQVEWPDYTDIVRGGLRDQGILIRSLCRDAIQILELTLMTKEAWPELHRAAEYRVEVFTEAARVLQKTDDRYRELRKRINEDEEYAAAIGVWISDRLPLARGPARAHALNEIAVFQLGIGSVCIARVKALFEHKTYVYPGQWGTNAKGEPTWVVNGRDMYQNPAITCVLRSAYFGSFTAMGYKFKEHYVSSHPDENKPELPIPLVALVATGVHAALDSWKAGRYNKQDTKVNKFSGESFKTVYQCHVKHLEDLKANHPLYFHRTMAKIYAVVVGPGDHGNSAEDYGDPMAVLDLTGLDDDPDGEGAEEVADDAPEEQLDNPGGLEAGIEEGLEEGQGSEEDLAYE